MSTNLNKRFITMEKKEEFTLDGECLLSIRLSMDITEIQKGIIAELGVYNFSVLVCIASYMDSNGESFPSQRKISELTGISINKVTKCVKELLEFKVNGNPLFTRTFAKGKMHKKTVYQFQSDNVGLEDIKLEDMGTDKKTEETPEEAPTEKPLTAPMTAKDVVVLFAETYKEVEKPLTAPMTAKDVVVLFAETYKEVFEDGYIVAWGKDMKLVKDKLIPNFKSEDLKEIVKTSVNRYSEKWANDRYPRPTISMMCGWLGKEAFKIVLAEKKQEESMQVRIESAQQSESEMDRFLNW